VYSILSCCGCLLTVDEEESTVRFVHHSVKKYILRELKTTGDATFTAEEAQRTIADIIVTYLGYGVFGTELSTMKIPQVMIQAAPSNVIRATMGSSSTVASLALNLLKPRKHTNFDIGKTLAEARKALPSQFREKFWFYTYAKKHWINHVFYVSGQKMTMFNPSMKLITSPVYEADILTKDYWIHLNWATENGNEAVVKLLLETSKVDVDSKDQYGQTPLSLAARNGNEAAVKLLLETGKVDVDSKNQYGKTPLLWEAKNGNEAVVKLLQEHSRLT
jgi:ankyrin repeat domain-containing protein 50